MALVCGDALHLPLAGESVHCVVTSPPYWSLRRYPIPDLTWPDGWRGQLGLEPTIELYVAHIVAVFREVWRVLRADGTCWVNLGDSYAGSWGNYGGQNRGNGKQREITNGSQIHQESYDGLERWRPPSAGPGLKPKDLCLIPARVALALQADGWYVRSEITLCKVAPMPESVTDRPTSATEKLYLLSKGERYFYDADAVRESISEASYERWGNDPHTKRRPDGQPTYAQIGGENTCGSNPAGRNLRNWWLWKPDPYPDAHFATFPRWLPERCIMAGTRVGDTVLDPFGGSGTVGEVAEALGRRWVCLELSGEYIHKQARQRTAQMGLFV